MRLRSVPPGEPKQAGDLQRPLGVRHGGYVQSEGKQVERQEAGLAGEVTYIPLSDVHLHIDPFLMDKRDDILLTPALHALVSTIA